MIVNGQRVKFCPSIFVAIEFHGNQPGRPIPKPFAKHPTTGL